MPNDHPTKPPTRSMRASRRSVRPFNPSGRVAKSAFQTDGAEAEASASFGRLNLSPNLLQSAQRMGYTRPTPIQHAAITLLLEGRDLLASSATGSCKTADFLERHSVPCGRIHGSRSQAQRTEALAGFRKGRFQVLVATDIAARGLDVVALDLVVNFDVPGAAEDYIHRVGRTARAEATGNAYTLVAPEDEGGLRAIERGIGQRIPRKTLPGFDYRQKSEGRFEVPLAERLQVIRARKFEERSRARARRRSNATSPAGRSEGLAGRRGETLPNRNTRAGASPRRSGPALDRPASRVRDRRS